MSTGNKPTRKEYDTRIDAVAKLLVQGAKKGEIKKQAKDQWGVSARTVENYLARARERLIAEMDEPKEVLVLQALHIYEAVINDGESYGMEKIKARERIDKLLGLESPFRHELSGPGGKPIQTSTLSPEAARKIAEDPDMAEAAKMLGLGLGLPTGDVDD